MRILLTGSRGFIGSYFKHKYSKQHDIETFSFQNDSINDLNLEGVDTVVHLSALVHKMKGVEKELYFQVNVDNTLDLALKAKESGVKHFVFMSSVKVYGEESDIPYTETTECQPQDDYALSKFVAENKLREIEDECFTVSIIRTPIVYGYGVNANMKSLVHLVENIPVLPFANIQNKRSMIYIGNLCYMMNEIIKQHKPGVFLASDDQAISTTRLIELIANELDKKIYLIQIPFFKSLLKIFKPSLYKRLYGSLEVNNIQTVKSLNLKNPYTMDEGIHLMIHGNDK